MSNNLFIVKPNESWNPFQLISQVENLFFFLNTWAPFSVLHGSLVLINVETPNPSNYSVDFADCTKTLVETLVFKDADWFIGWNSWF